MDKTAKLSDGDVGDAIKAHEAYAALSSRISDRMNYIVHFCVEQVGGKVEWWDWQNGGDGGDKAPGDFIHSYSNITPETLDITGEWSHGSKMTFLDKDGEEWDLQWGEFPTRWLHEDFEEEYINGLRLYKEQQEQKKEKDKTKKAKAKEVLDALIASAKSKLTPEEIRALKKGKLNGSS